MAFLILIAGLGFLANSPGCQKNPIVPPDRLPDTTSHSFIWTIDTLGDGNSSVLNDVAIINDHLAYAVGEIYLKDSTGQVDPERYNIAKWDGENWVLGRATVNFRGSNVTLPLEGIFAWLLLSLWGGNVGAKNDINVLHVEKYQRHALSIAKSTASLPRSVNKSK